MVFFFLQVSAQTVPGKELPGVAVRIKWGSQELLSAPEMGHSTKLNAAIAIEGREIKYKDLMG